MKTLDIEATMARLTADATAENPHARTLDSYSAATLLAELDVTAAPTPGARRATSRHVTTDGTGAPRVGRFVIGDELGRGGMGRVIEAHDPELLRTVAVKLLLGPREVDPEHLNRFVTEARITAQLDHPNIVPIHELGVTSSGQLFIVMKRVQGRSLREVLSDIDAGDEMTAMQWNRFRLLMSFGLVCGAVGYAHDRGVLHRDLKPDNIMLGDFGQVLVMDWGIARLIGDETERLTAPSGEQLSTTHTIDGTAIGTPGYMSPEQARGRIRELDARSDVWSLGAILYELLTHQRAYRGETVHEILAETVSGPPIDPRERAPSMEIDEEIATVCLTALAARPEERFGSTMALAQGVGQYLEGQRHRKTEECEDTAFD